MKGIQQSSVFIFMSILIEVTVVVISANLDSKSVDISSLPEWKQVFINYTTWRGHYKYNNTPYACSLGLITADQYVKVSFVDRNTHIDLLGYYIMGQVIFNKTDVFQTNDRIQANAPFQLAGNLSWNPNKTYWTYTADVTIPQEKPFSQFKLTTNTEKSTVVSEKSKTTAIVLGIVFTFVSLGVILMGGLMIWSYRKGLLRHIPMSYRTHRNAREERRASFDSREDTVHI